MIRTAAHDVKVRSAIDKGTADAADGKMSSALSNLWKARNQAQKLAAKERDQALNDVLSAVREIETQPMLENVLGDFKSLEGNIAASLEESARTSVSATRSASSRDDTDDVPGLKSAGDAFFGVTMNDKDRRLAAELTGAILRDGESAKAFFPSSSVGFRYVVITSHRVVALDPVQKRRPEKLQTKIVESTDINSVEVIGSTKLSIHRIDGSTEEYGNLKPDDLEDLLAFFGTLISPATRDFLAMRALSAKDAERPADESASVDRPEETNGRGERTEDRGETATAIRVDSRTLKEAVAAVKSSNDSYRRHIRDCERDLSAKRKHREKAKKGRELASLGTLQKVTLYQGCIEINTRSFPLTTDVRASVETSGNLEVVQGWEFKGAYDSREVHLKIQGARWGKVVNYGQTAGPSAGQIQKFAMAINVAVKDAERAQKSIRSNLNLHDAHIRSAEAKRLEAAEDIRPIEEACQTLEGILASPVDASDREREAARKLLQWVRAESERRIVRTGFS